MISPTINSQTIIFLAHLISTSIMVGVIWVIQLVHYPSFHFIDKDIYSAFQKFHMNKISLIVLPLMIVEIITGVILLNLHNFKNAFILISFIILIIIWAITGVFFSSVHSKLIIGYQELIVNQLVAINWIRTLLWTLRLVFLFCFIYYTDNKF
tara:strand:- start:490 stop:948 length:459 start_codon:yes stop_codon:yes gene_type:complete